MTDLIRVRHTISGVIAEVPQNIAEHEVLGAYLEKVGPEAKPYLPEMHRASLPANPTDEQIAIAQAAGFVSEDEAKELRKAAHAKVAEAEAKVDSTPPQTEDKK